MPLRIAKPPADAAKVAASSLRRVLARPAADRRLLTDASSSNLSLMAPHPVFVLGLIDVSAAWPLTRVRQVGWRFLVEDRGRTIAGVEVDIDPDSSGLRFGRIIQGPYEPATERAVRSAESSTQVQAGAFELNLLRVPALYVEAIWLRSNERGSDLIIPLAPAPDRFVSFRLYPDSTFLALLRAEADAHPAFDSPPRVAVPAD